MVSNKPAIALEKEDHKRDAEFKKALHGNSAELAGGFTAMLAKGDREAKKAAVDEYFKHFDNKSAKTETQADRDVSSPPVRSHFTSPRSSNSFSYRRAQQSMPP